ncbi:MAG: HAD-IA family hydrolase [Candidatus Nitrohelix vancouverensis]|uniref:phosphoglycolate phosphatase n=1 Tax=Candidatus Nitrohelix vancouverensis TaxID=2705534 RepID=A0A7T0G2W3_9BACT|nr:MAG: HAD-IA family hydrolase [Candidatus Nitrohelix vancouverensis]
MKSVALVVYDFDGTLVDTLDDIAASVNAVLVELGLSAHPTDTIRKFVGKGVVNLMTRALEGNGDVENAVALFKRHYADHLLEHTRLYPNGREIVEHFSHKKQSILSNKPESFIEQILDGLNFRSPFLSVVGGDTFATRKPDPEGLRHIMNQHGVSPAEVVMVGDSDVDMETGKRAGVATVGVSFGFCDPGSNPQFPPDFVIDDLSELRRIIQ